MTVYFELTSSQGSPARIALQPGVQRISAAVGDRYRIVDDATGRTPPDIVVKRLDNHMIIEGLPDGASVELTDFYARCGVSSPCTLSIESNASLAGGTVEISPASPPLQALTDGSFVVYPSGYSGAPAIAVADSEGFPRAAIYAVGGLAIAALAGAGGGGGGGGSTAVSATPAPPPPAPEPAPAPGPTPVPEPVPVPVPAPEPVPVPVPVPVPAPAPVPQAPPKVATVTAVTDDVAPRTGNVASGGTTNDGTPTVSGSLSAPLAAGETVQILRNGVLLSTPVEVEGASWRVTDGSLGDGSYSYTARVVGADGAGLSSDGYRIIVDRVSDKTATITGAIDDASPGIGTVRDGGSTNDATPTLTGRLSSSLAPGETLQILRDDAVIGTATQAAGTSWNFTDQVPGNGNYDYTVRVVDAAGNIGRESATFDLRVSLGRSGADDDDDGFDAGSAAAAEPLTLDELAASGGDYASAAGTVHSQVTWTPSSIDSLIDPEVGA